MHGHIEQRRFEGIFAVALSAILALELAPVRIRVVAVRAKIVRNGLLEIATLVTVIAGGFGMRTMQGEFGLVVIEADGRSGLQHLPAGGDVAALAGSGERSAVRVLMAIGAGGERNVFVRNKDLGVFACRLVALRARHFLVQSGQRVVGGAVIEAAGGLPGFQRVTTGAVRSQLAAMLIGMAVRAGRR